MAVLQRIFAEREEATKRALSPLLSWTTEGSEPLEAVLHRAVEGYLAFLLERPAFVRLVQREELSGGNRLRATPRASRAISDAFEALRRAGPRHGLRAFRVDDAVLVFVALTFSPVAQRSTFMAALDRDLDHAATRRRHIALVADQLLHLLTAHA